MKQVFAWLVTAGVLCYCEASQAQPTNIVSAEYFIDSDPGYGNGTSISIGTPGPVLSAISFNAGVGALTNGMHTLFVRSKNAGGSWSQTNKMFFVKVQGLSGNTSTVTNIDKLEYFFDNDPGEGNGVNVPVSASTNIGAFVFNADVSSLSTGVHTIYVRSRDAEGKWSVVSKHFFGVYQPLVGNNNTVVNITYAEYFFNSDPGWGNGTSIPLTASSDIGSLVFNADVSALGNGVHTMYVRSKDANGKWSVTSVYHFAKVQSLSGNPNTVSVVDKAEYFFNTDPGLGNGINIPVTAATDINGYLVNVDVSTLFTGLHTLYVRTRDASGKWSITSSVQFSRIQGLQPNAATVNLIDKVEYFIDADPGEGLGVNVPVTPGVDISGLAFNADLTGLPEGVHTLYVRSRDTAGQWSQVYHSEFVRVRALSGNPHLLTNIVEAEYYFDDDPGEGNGAGIPVVAGLNVSGLSFNADVTALGAGVHQMYVRTKDAEGKWSVVNSKAFAKVGALSGNPNSKSNIVYAEYFVDADPGLGNGLPLSFTPAQDVSSIAFNVDMTVLLNGNHELYIRTRDAQGNWSITNVVEFHGGTMPLSVKLIEFTAKLREDRTVLVEWVTEQERNVDYYLVEHSRNGLNWEELGQQAPKSSNSTMREHYSMVDEHPGTGVVYYRLTEFDKSGGKTSSPVRMVRIEGEGAVSTIFPNPCNGKVLHVRSELFLKGEVVLTLTDAGGRVFVQRRIEGQQAGIVTLSDLKLPPGNYYVNLSSGGETESLKLVVLSAE